MRNWALAIGTMIILVWVAGARADIVPPYPEYEIGVGLDEGEPFPFIGRIGLGSPAEKAGLKKDDRVLAINGRYTGTKLPHYFLVKSLNKGPENSEVTLVILRGEDEVLILTAKRTLKVRR